MSLLGKGALAIWHDIAPGGETDYHEWHSKEHLLERVGVPGFLRGQRGQAVSGAPAYLNLYEVEALATLTSKPYLDRLNHPTPWTQRSLGLFRNTNRTLCRVVASAGEGVCGHLLTIQIAARSGRDEELAGWLAATVPALVERPGVLSAHYLEGDAAASRTETEEKRLRSTRDAIADRAVLVGGCDAGPLDELRSTVLAAAALVARGAEEAQPAGIYRLVHCITEADLPKAG